VKRCPESCAKHDDTMAIAMRREVDLEVLTKSLTQKLTGAVAEGVGHQHWLLPVLASALNARLGCG